MAVMVCAWSQRCLHCGFPGAAAVSSPPARKVANAGRQHAQGGVAVSGMLVAPFLCDAAVAIRRGLAVQDMNT